MARRTKEEALETREQLLDAAERVFLERGVGHASLAEVADAAGVTRGAIYHHFDSKAELFEAMVERAEMPIDAAFESGALRRRPLDSLAKKRRSTRCAIGTSSRVRLSRSYFCVASTPTNWRQWRAPLARAGQCCTLCGSLLDKAVELGQLPRDTDTRMAGHLLYALIGGLMRDWVQAPRSFDLKAAAPQLITLFMAGLRAAPPLKTRADIRLVKS
jgi:TetR/AcrR family acrAB operon transcriptional repressor